MDISQSVNVYSPRPSSEDTFLSLCRSDAGPATCRRRARPILSVLYYNGIIFFLSKKKDFDTKSEQWASSPCYRR